MRFCCRAEPVIALLMTLLVGCGGQVDRMTSELSTVSSADSSVISIDRAYEETLLESEPSDANENGELLIATPAVANRKIVYTSHIGLVVEDYKAFENDLPMLVDKHSGFVSSSETDRRYNDSQSGNWVVRVPVSSYSEFINGVNGLGFAESKSETAQDVTEEYVDVEARIRNGQQLESRILKMLDEQTGKLADVLEIERELARVRESTERMQGKLRLLQDQASLATITILCREKSEYVPAAAPSLTSRVALAWGNSFANLRRLTETCVVTLVALFPWAVLLGLAIFIVNLIRKRKPKATLELS